MSVTFKDDIHQILKFVASCNGRFKDSKCDIRESPLGGLGVFAKTKIAKGESILTLNKSSIFSASNSSIANLLCDNGIDGMLALNIAFIYETTVFKNTSHWYQFLRTIRIRDDQGHLNLPPSFWNANAKQLLKGTSFDTLFDALTPEEEIIEGFEIAVDLARKWNDEFGLEMPKGFLDISEENHEKDYNLKLEKFISVAYTLSSRGFEIDAYHETALVPIADLFNHHVSNPDLKFVSLYDVCDKCGEPGMCKHLIAEEYLEAEDQDKNIPKAGGTEICVIDEDLINSLENDLQKECSKVTADTEDEDDGIENPDECVDLILKNDVAQDQEIFNSYGELSNVFLLARYGFTVPGNQYDIVHLGPEFMKVVKKEEKYQEKVKWWSQVGHGLFSAWYVQMRQEDEEDEGEAKSDDLPDDAGDEIEEESEEDEEEGNDGLESWLSQLYIDSRGEPSPSTWALANLLTLTAVQWELLFSKKATPHISDSIIDEQKLPFLAKKDNPHSKKLLSKLLKDKQLPRIKGDNSSHVTNATRSMYHNAQTLVQSEHNILERCLKRLS
ncbi:protein-lysine N-methyltransferase [Saccharomyces paradoxus]|uniref:Protein-lysine N-methyltransferase n=1 Tax=Saccharomyces paradoxus TaxID=27291 RepID=A0A8B8ULV8_SACPA|nr:Rkm3 [Saccharomyces paradoxus]QHS71594.1 Rkm3 [Saccharomyces paradoxus]